MENILIASFDLEVGGVERSLISMLNNFNYTDYHVDVMLYSHTGDFMNQLPAQPNLLKESDSYKTFRMSIKDTFKAGYLTIGFARLLAKYKAAKNQGSEKAINKCNICGSMHCHFYRSWMQHMMWQ